MFTAPTALRAIRKADPDGRLRGRYDTSTLRALFVAGERLDPETYAWASETLGVPVVDHWWQTETGWAVSASPLGIERLPLKPGSPSVPMPGYDVRVVDAEGNDAPAGTEGSILVRLPLPPGTLATLWGNDERFVAGYLTYQPGYYLTGDSGYVDEDGYLFVMGRTDDIINVAGHRLSTGAIEQVVAKHDAVAECAVVAQRDEIKGHVPVAYVVLEDGADGAVVDPDALSAELVALVRDLIGALACFQGARVVEALPKTRSGKVLRKTIRQIADGEAYVVPATIEDPSVLEHFAARLAGRPA